MNKILFIEFTSPCIDDDPEQPLYQATVRTIASITRELTRRLLYPEIASYFR